GGVPYSHAHGRLCLRCAAISPTGAPSRLAPQGGDRRGLRAVCLGAGAGIGGGRDGEGPSRPILCPALGASYELVTGMPNELDQVMGAISLRWRAVPQPKSFVPVCPARRYSDRRSNT